MRLDIRYTTRFAYDEAVRESHNELRACPTTDERQTLVGYRVATSPPARIHSFTDYWGTRVDTFGIRVPHTHLEIVAEAAVETRPSLPPAQSPAVAALADPAFRAAHTELLAPSPHTAWGASVADAAAQRWAHVDGDVVSGVLGLHRLVGHRLRYLPGVTEVGVDVEEVLAAGEGVCQDYAHLLIAMCRSVGVPARYVSGYLFTADDASGADTAADVVRVQTHAWVEAAVPGLGWLGLDPTNQQVVGERHVTIGRGRDYDDVAPLRGVFSGPPGHELDVEVELRRVAQQAASAQ